MMPDSLTHLLFGVSLAMLILRNRSKPEAALLVLGALLPDIERPISWVLIYIGYDFHLVYATHSIIGVIVLAYAASSCFELDSIEFRSRFKLIMIGCIEHLILDLSLWPWEEMGLYLFYPIKIPMSYNLFWSDYPWFFIYGLIAFMISTILYFTMRHFENARINSSKADDLI